jgi:hypothetical protein
MLHRGDSERNRTQLIKRLNREMKDINKSSVTIFFTARPRLVCCRSYKPELHEATTAIDLTCFATRCLFQTTSSPRKHSQAQFRSCPTNDEARQSVQRSHPLQSPPTVTILLHLSHGPAIEPRTQLRPSRHPRPASNHLDQSLTHQRCNSRPINPPYSTILARKERSETS